MYKHIYVLISVISILISVYTHESSVRKIDKEGLTLDLCTSYSCSTLCPPPLEGLMLNYIVRILAVQMQMAGLQEREESKLFVIQA